MDKTKSIISPSEPKSQDDGEFSNKYKVTGEGSHFGTDRTTGDSDSSPRIPGAFEDDTATTASVVSGIPGKPQSGDPVVAEETLAAGKEPHFGDPVPAEDTLAASKESESGLKQAPEQEGAPVGTALTTGSGPVEETQAEGSKVAENPSTFMPHGGLLANQIDPRVPPNPEDPKSSGREPIVSIEPPLTRATPSSQPTESHLGRGTALGAGVGGGLGAGAGLAGAATTKNLDDDGVADPLDQTSGRTFPLNSDAPDSNSGQFYAPGQIGTYPAGEPAPTAPQSSSATAASQRELDSTTKPTVTTGVGSGVAPPTSGPLENDTVDGVEPSIQSQKDTVATGAGTGPMPAETGQLTSSGPISTLGEGEGDHTTRDTALAGGAGAAIGAGAYEASRDPRSPETGPAPNTAGPHKSDILNKLDPRVDHDLSKQNDGTTGPTLESSKPKTTDVTDDTRDHHGRDTALLGAGAGAGALGGYEAEKKLDGDEKLPEERLAGSGYQPAVAESAPVVPPQDRLAGSGTESFPPSETTEKPLTNNAFERDIAPGVGSGPVVAETDRRPDPIVEPIQPPLPTEQEPRVQKDDHLGRDTALVGGAGVVAGGVVGSELSEKEAKKLEKEHEKEQKAIEKQEAKEQKAAEKAAEKDEKDEKKKGGIFGLFKRDKSDKESQAEEREGAPIEPSGNKKGEEVAAGAGAAGAAGAAGLGAGALAASSTNDSQSGPPPTTAGPGDDPSSAALKDSAISSGSNVAGPAGTFKPGFGDAPPQEDAFTRDGAFTEAAVGTTPDLSARGKKDEITTPPDARSKTGFTDTTTAFAAEQAPPSTKTTTAPASEFATQDSFAAPPSTKTTTEQASEPKGITQDPLEPPLATKTTTGPATEPQFQSQEPPSTKTTTDPASEPKSTDPSSGSSLGPTTTHGAYGEADQGRNKLHKEPPKKVLEKLAATAGGGGGSSS